MSILKYKDPKTGEFKRINPYKAELSFVGKDGIVVNKEANSEMVEISGKGCVQKDTTPARVIYAHSYDGSPLMLYPQTKAELNEWWLPTYRNATEGDTATGNGVLLTYTPTKDFQCTNKKYVDDNYVGKVKFTNLEQALNGYILDTTKEAYADLDSAVLKDSVAVGDNVYPIADKTRALVTQIEGKSTKMVQLLDKSKFSATTTKNGVTFTNNGDGTITVNGTVTADNHAFILIQSNIECIANHKYLIIGCPEGGLGGKTYGISGQSSGNPIVWDEGKGNIFSFDSLALVSFYLDFYTNDATYTNKVVTPNLFDLTAMNREDITTAEQFKAEFPELYPYENGNIYPAKISGVKFTGKNLFNYNWTRITVDDVRNASIVEALENGVILQGNKDEKPNNQYYGNGWFAPGYIYDKDKINIQAGDRVTISANYEILESDNTSATVGVHFYSSRDQSYASLHSVKTKVLTRIVQTFTIKTNNSFYPIFTLNSNKVKITDIQVEISDAPSAYEPYTEPVSVTLPETYDLHGIGDYKDYLEITKNEDNELYTLKKVQVIEKVILNGTENWTPYLYGDKPFTNVGYSIPLNPKFIKWTYRGTMMNLLNKLPTVIIDQKGYGAGDESATLYVRLPNIATADDMKAHVLSMYEAGTPYIFYGAIATPVETVITTNLTYEQVTAIRHNGGLIEVEGNVNKGYARPTVKNTVVYRLTATSTAEG